MCGIAGIFNYRDHQPINRDQLARMATSMVHRGPDDEGFYVRARRTRASTTSIIDLKTGHQPMFNEDGSVVIVFNGEIYNHEELRRELEAKGHTFKTHSDTEAIIHAFEEYGNDFERRLTGMFGFALWDERRRMLVLSRDRLGIKPLYYTEHRGRLLFASEIKALLSVEGVDRRVDLDALESYLTVRYVPGPKTMFKDIHKLQPGHTLTVRDGKLKIHSYWDLNYTEEPRNEEELGEELKGLLVEVQVLRSALGDLAVQSGFDTFLARRGEHIPNDLARLKGARLVAAIEAEEGRRLHESVIKSLTGGDTITARFLHAEWFDFRPTYKLWLAANHKPRVKGTDEAIWRRIRLVPFNVTIPEAERDGTLADKLRAELPGVLPRGREGLFRHGSVTGLACRRRCARRALATAPRRTRWSTSSPAAG